MMSLPTIRIELSEPKWVDAVAAAVFAALALAGLMATPTDGSQGNISYSGGVPTVFAFFVFVRWWRHANCWLVLSDRGIVLRAYSADPYFFWRRRYYCVGVIPWNNLRAVGTTRWLMTACLGLSVLDLDSFVGSRVQFTDEKTVAAISRNSLETAGRFMRAVGNLEMTLRGLTELPRSGGEGAVLAWNHENYGYHIVIEGRPLFFFGRPFKGGPKGVAEVIRQRARYHGGLNRPDVEA
jgi:hypothetical protein